MNLQAGRLVLALDRTWLAIRHRHRQVPVAAMVLAGHVQGGRPLKLGHWATSSWAADGTSEVTIGSGLLAPDCSGVVYERDPGERLLAVLLHEASHGLAFARGVKDTGKDGRYHNARFLHLALELDLEVAKRKPWGFNHTRLSDFVRKKYAQEIEALRSIATGYRRAPAARTAHAKPRRPLYVCACQPPRKMRMSPRTFKAAAIACRACGCEFRGACKQVR